MWHNLKPFKLNDEDPSSILKTKNFKPFSFAMCHYVNCLILWLYTDGIQFNI